MTGLLATLRGSLSAKGSGASRMSRRRVVPLALLTLLACALQGALTSPPASAALILNRRAGDDS